jgi:hypothetical protein
MRKGSKKPINLEMDSSLPVYSKTISEYENILEYDKTHALGLPSIEKEVLDILLRLCDACHEMDTRTEPWASIRKDIERLK